LDGRKRRVVSTRQKYALSKKPKSIGVPKLTFDSTRYGRKRRAGLGWRESDSGLFFLLTIMTPRTDCDARTLVDDFALSCGRTRHAVAPIPQITSVDPGRPAKAFGVLKRSEGLQPATTRRNRARRPPRAYQKIRKQGRDGNVPPRRHHRFPEQSARGGRGYRGRQQLVVRTL